MLLDARSPPIDLDALLPSEIAGTGQGWFTRYRRYPAFSRPWRSGRAKVWGVWFVVLVAFGTLQALAACEEDCRRLPEWLMVTLGLSVFFLPSMLAGPWLAGRVRAIHWPARRELAALCAAIALVALSSLLLLNFAWKPYKAAIGEALGVKSMPKVAIGLTVHTEDQAPAAAATASPASAASAAAEHLPDKQPPLAEALAWLVTGVFQAWFAGAWGVLAVVRERRAFADLQRRRELHASEHARRQAETRLSLLQAQVEPHFLFNTLAGVRSAVTGDPQRAVDMIDRLVDYLRASIPRLRNNRDGAEATLGAQLDVVRAYLALMSTRIPRLSFSIDADDELLARPFPPLMLITLAENAVKHGIEPKIGPGHVTVSARRTGPAGSERLEVTVRDDGVGFGGDAAAAQAGSGIGLMNIRGQLASLYGEGAGLTLKALAEGGVAATIHLPLVAATEAPVP